MKKEIKNVACIALLFLTVAACKKKEVVPEPGDPNPYANASLADLKNYLQQNRSNDTQIFTINSEQTETITGAKGTEFTFYANSFQ